MFAWLMHLMSKIFGRTAKENMEKMEVANDVEEESTEDEAVEEDSEDSSDDDEEPDSEDDGEGGGGGHEEGLYSSAQGGFG